MDEDTIYTSRPSARVADRESRASALARNPMKVTSFHSFHGGESEYGSEGQGQGEYMPRAGRGSSTLSASLRSAEESSKSLDQEEENVMWKRSFMDRHRRRMHRIENDSMPASATRLASAPHRRRISNRMRQMFLRGEDEVASNVNPTTEIGGDDEDAHVSSRGTRHIAEESDAIDSRPRVRRTRHKHLPALRTMEDEEMSHRESMRARSREVQRKSRNMGGTRDSSLRQQGFTRVGATSGYTSRMIRD